MLLTALLLLLRQRVLLLRLLLEPDKRLNINLAPPPVDPPYYLPVFGVLPLAALISPGKPIHYAQYRLSIYC